MTAVIAALAILLLAPATSQALELGVQDDWNPTAAATAGHDLGATWVRMILTVGDKNGPARIRAAHTAGFQVLVTIGGSGTDTLRPSSRSLLAYLRTLPKTEKYTVINEPDLTGIKPCTYLNTWMAVRRVLGRRLLFGDFSPHRPLSMTAAIRNCERRMPAHLEFALHPYQKTDPLKPGANEGSIGNLAYARRFLRQACGLRVDWWLTEFGYLYDGKYAVTDEQAAAMWPRALAVAEKVQARMLNVYMAEGATWDSRPRQLAWASLTGRVPAPPLQQADEDPVPFDPGYY